jgi:hypothetical protein
MIEKIKTALIALKLAEQLKCELRHSDASSGREESVLNTLGEWLDGGAGRTPTESKS